jgi:hypothetical protein
LKQLIQPTVEPRRVGELPEKKAVPPADSLYRNKAALQEFLIHGVKYSFPPERGELT